MRIVIVLCFLVVIPAIGFSDTLVVPDDYPTIQEAINAAANGDTVLVKPGTYGLIHFKGKAITIQSEQGPQATILDGNQAGIVAVFNMGENQDSVLDGFTLTNGLAPNTSTSGGGIRCDMASPSILNCHIRDNTSYGPGGGIYCHDSDAQIYNCEIRGNSTEDLNYIIYPGGGFYCSGGNPVLDQCIVIQNYGASGGGISCYQANPTITNNIISHNEAAASDGGGIWCHSCSALIRNNTIYSNLAWGDYWDDGMKDNPPPHDDVYGGGICIFAPSGSTKIINNTVCKNTVTGYWQFYGAGIYCQDSFSQVINSIVWNNTGTSQIDGSGSVTYSNVQYGYSGTGNIHENPLFAGSLDFHLTWLSPCINRGTPHEAPDHDIEGDPRPHMGAIDMGSDEFTGLHPLEADVFSVSESTGGVVDFTLDGSAGNGGRLYVLLGSVTGTAPGTPLPGGQAGLRMNWDVFTDIVFSNLNTPFFLDFYGHLNPSGKGQGQLNTLGPLPSGFTGVKMYYAFCLGWPWEFVSNPITVEILP